MKAVVAIVGRPNVGKSTLFNRLTGTRDALVADHPGVTRDRLVGNVRGPHGDFLLMDTGGLGSEDALADRIGEHSLRAAAEADLVVYLGEADGLSGADEALIAQLRALGCGLILAVNKSEGRPSDEVTAEWHRLGAGRPVAISASRGSGIEALMEAIASRLPPASAEDPTPDARARTHVAFIGRPNVGKSTLVNRILGQERVLAGDQPGTTRDRVFVDFERRGTAFRLIDTAGVRRRARTRDGLERLSVVKTLQSIEQSDVAVLLLDAREGVMDQDATLAGLVLETGRSLILALNKWDGLDPAQRQRVIAAADRRLGFVHFAPRHHISALHGTGVGKLLDEVRRVYRSAHVTASPSQLTELLRRAVSEHPPPLARGRRIKLRYAHLGGQKPLRIVIHGNQTGSVPEAYRRYLENYFRKRLELRGTAVHVAFRQGHNPFEGHRNTLTRRQRNRRRRLMRHVKK